MYLRGRSDVLGVTNAVSFAIARSLSQDGPSIIEGFGRNFVIALNGPMQFENLLGSSFPPASTSETRLRALFPDSWNYSGRYSQGDYLLVGFSVESVTPVNRGVTSRAVLLPGPRDQPGEVRDVPRLLLEVKVRLLLAALDALAADPNDGPQTVSVVISFFVEPVIGVGMSRDRTLGVGNRLSISFQPFRRGSRTSPPPSLVVSLVSALPLNQARMLENWSDQWVPEVDLTALLTAVPALSERLLAAVSQIEPIDLSLDLPAIPGLDPVLANAGLRLDGDTLYLQAQFEDRALYFPAEPSAVAASYEAAAQIQADWERFYLEEPPTWEGIQGETVSAGVTFDDLVAPLRRYLPGVLRGVLASADLFHSVVRVDAVRVSTSANGTIAVGLDLAIPDRALDRDVRVGLEVNLSVVESTLDNEQVMYVRTSIRARINASDVTWAASTGGLMQLIMIAYRGCGARVESDLDLLVGLAAGLAQLVAAGLYPLIGIAVAAFSSVINGAIEKAIASALVSALASRSSCGDALPPGWIVVNPYVDVVAEDSAAVIRLRTERALGELTSRLARNAADNGLLAGLSPIRLRAEARSGSLALGLTMAHARDGIRLLREAENGQLIIAQLSQFSRPNDCAEYIEYSVSIHNPTSIAVVVSVPLIVGSTEMSRAVARDGWVSINNESRRVRDLDRILSAAPGMSRRWWVIPPGESIRLRFVITEETARFVASRGAQEYSFRYVILTSVGVFPHEASDPLALFALTDTEEGRQVRSDRCLERIAGRNASAPAQGPRMARELVEQFVRERIESRYTLDAAGRRLDVPGLFPTSAGGALPTSVNPQLQPWETGIPLPATAFDANPGVFARLMESVSQRK